MTASRASHLLDFGGDVMLRDHGDGHEVSSVTEVPIRWLPATTPHWGAGNPQHSGRERSVSIIVVDIDVSGGKAYAVQLLTSDDGAFADPDVIGEIPLTARGSFTLGFDAGQARVHLATRLIVTGGPGRCNYSARIT